MSDHQPLSSLDSVAQKWRVLAERRRAHFVDLFESGRWKHYYSEEQFLHHLREAIRVSERWAMIAPPPVEETIDESVAVSDDTTTAIDETVTLSDQRAEVIEQPVPGIAHRSAA